MVGQTPIDEGWSALARLDADMRQQAMRTRFAQLATKGETERVAEAEAMVRAEYALDDEALHDFTVSRLRAWIELSENDPAQVHSAVAAYDRVFETMPAQMAMKRASVVQTVAREQLASAEIEALFDLIPSLVRQLPRASQDAAGRAVSQARVEVARSDQAARKPFWKFW